MGAIVMRNTAPVEAMTNGPMQSAMSTGPAHGDRCPIPAQCHHLDSPNTATKMALEPTRLATAVN